jgi:GxxExxY protein
MSTDEKRINTITEAIIGCAFKVSNKLGSGYSEKCYENALAYELRKAGFEVKQQFPITVWYEDIIIGDYIGDLLVENVLIELKAIKALDDAHAAQCINYLTTTRLPICLLLNFSQRVEIKRLAGPSFQSSSV